MTADLVEEHYPNGQLKCQYSKLNGQLHGEYKSWHENGQKKTHCYYHNGKTHEYKRWDENGKIKTHKFYASDELIINFIKEPQLYPKTEIQRLNFMLKYGAPVLEIA